MGLRYFGGSEDEDLAARNMQCDKDSEQDTALANVSNKDHDFIQKGENKRPSQ